MRQAAHLANVVLPFGHRHRAAGVEHEADTRGTDVEKRNTYSLTGIDAALRAAIVEA